MLVFTKGTQGGFLPGGVAVESENHFPTPGPTRAQQHPGGWVSRVTNQAPGNAHVTFPKCGAAGGHSGLHPGQLGGHHVCVAFNHHNLVSGGNSFLSQV